MAPSDLEVDIEWKDSAPAWHGVDWVCSRTLNNNRRAESSGTFCSCLTAPMEPGQTGAAMCARHSAVACTGGGEELDHPALALPTQLTESLSTGGTSCCTDDAAGGTALDGVAFAWEQDSEPGR